MAKKYAFLFPGQGAQAQGMIKDVCEAFPEARKVIDEISKVTGKDIPKLLWETEQTELNRSDNSQLAITAASLAVMAALKSKGIEPSAAMGFSLGEFPALYAAGILSFEDVIKVVCERGSIMQKVCEQIAEESAGNAPGMSAILGLPPEKVEEIANGIEGAYAANLNSVKQTVISGTADGLTKAEEAAKAAGARRTVRLAVAGPFHSPLMQRAADNFKVALEPYTFCDPKITLFSNVTGKKVTEGAPAKASAVDHLTHPVRWTDEEKVLADMIGEDKDNEWVILEVGPGKVLSGLWGQTELGATLPCTSVNTADGINAL
ncbi:ACP S-malonyltransferase [Treponema ruminis]|uniref:Malonyl CoA-acyl carrier protein transacylase n=1 Tax=Treponema ruminis TaxID=744515 RepID=A0A7W8G9X7_9SPIR|nr:ACP S-malonyltransferase [Treponema ruminis]MBB5226511.1 [acyl-carrier-protein] S-malonyltransferase [Treponema ruminis]QSI02585.1 ACP S-malonyltransferase [Treponema ruminis]